MAEINGALIPLVIDAAYVNFLIQITERTEFRIEVDVFEVSSWGMDNAPLEKALYCKAEIKWDGGSHVWFGEEGTDGEPNGYLHLCGVDSWKKHGVMIEALYKFAGDNIEKFADNERWAAGGEDD